MMVASVLGTLSAKVLGKRRQDPEPTSSIRSRGASSQGIDIDTLDSKQQFNGSLLNKNGEPPRIGDKRITRSSRTYGSGLEDNASASGSEDSSTPLYLPLSTSVLLTTRDLPDLTSYPPPWKNISSYQSVIDSHYYTGVPCNAPDPEFRLIPFGESFDRSRHVAANTDTSDAHYLRLHRFPEVLEKRSARLEREKLIHERSKLISEIETLRGRGWVYHGAQGGKGEETRKRRLVAAEERLKRYDALLPNQSRKSGYLNNGSHSLLNVNSRIGSVSSRGSSPAFLPRGATQQQDERQASSISASVDGGTTIRIKLSKTNGNIANERGQLMDSKRQAWLKKQASTNFNGSRSKHSEALSMDDEEGDERDSATPDLAHEAFVVDDAVHIFKSSKKIRGPKRNRKAEKLRAEERIRLGKKVRASLHKTSQTAAVKREPLMEENEMDWEEEFSEATEDEDLLSEELVHDENFSSGRIRQNPRPRLSTSSAKTTVSKHTIPKSKRVLGSFFHSETLRDSVALAMSDKSGRRSSGRVAYAFGQRLPDSSLMQFRDFELYGGTDGNDNSSSLEQMTYHRQSLKDGNSPSGHQTILVNGISIPASAITAAQPFYTPPKEPIRSVTPSPTGVKVTIDGDVIPTTPTSKTHTHGTRNLLGSASSKKSDTAMSPHRNL